MLFLKRDLGSQGPWGVEISFSTAPSGGVVLWGNAEKKGWVLTYIHRIFLGNITLVARDFGVSSQRPMVSY